MTSNLTNAARLAAKRRPLFSGESAEYAKAREALLAEEIELRRHIARVAEERRALPPGPAIARDYRFTDKERGAVSLSDLFGSRETLVTYFWMFGPARAEPCPMCANLLGPLNANAADIKQLVSLRVVGRSPLERQYAFARQRGWNDLDFVQCGDDYPSDIGVLLPDGSEYPALVVYRRDGGAVRLFWAGEMSGAMADPGQDPRGAPDLAPLWNILDLVPEGRGANWYPKLAY
ncbi:MAG TPA: DUF899 family protein [Rhizomicrobium sp.]|jgi:predicted dithiol-disulfide oxidoreductase (DUF899 family)|nr:DUF899 family protein [Rhizomicrobium sp.]